MIDQAPVHENFWKPNDEQVLTKMREMELMIALIFVAFVCYQYLKVSLNFPAQYSSFLAPEVLVNVTFKPDVGVLLYVVGLVAES